MKIYGLKLEAKFGSDLGTELATGIFDTPCLIVAHADPRELRNLWEKENYRAKIMSGEIAVLAISEAILSPPEGCNTPFFHCLRYGIPTLSQGEEPNSLLFKRFENLVREVKDHAAWSGIDIDRDIWSIVEREPWPEYLVAVYLGLLAGMPETVPEDMWTKAWEEYESLAQRFLMKERASKMTDLKCDVAKIRQILEMVQALHQT